MKKDIQNVVITFSLVTCMLYGGSFTYAKKVRAEVAAEKQAFEQQQNALKAQEAMQQQLLKQWEEQERLRTTELVRIEEEVTQKTQAQPQPTSVPVKANTQFADTVAKQQAQYAAQQKAAADALAAQKAADALAAQIAAQKAAADKAAAMAVKKSRQSRAS